MGPYYSIHHGYNNWIRRICQQIISGFDLFASLSPHIKYFIRVIAHNMIIYKQTDDLNGKRDEKFARKITVYGPRAARRCHVR